MDGFLRGMVLPEPPGVLANEPGAPASSPAMARLRALGEEVARLRPDALVIAPGDWLTTFHHYVARPPSPYPTDPALAHAFLEAGVAHHVRVVLAGADTPPRDEEMVLALGYLTPAADVPVVPISHCQLADLAETLRWGRAIGAAARATGRRILLVVTPGPAAARHRAMLLGALGVGVLGVPGLGPGVASPALRHRVATIFTR
jgi:aromatic ring-opening dioxygenase catalytic subunit (LigB family)